MTRAAAMMTIAKQRRAEVDRARQFFGKPQSSEDRKAQFDKLKQKLPCARCGQLGHWKDDNDCPVKVKVVNWEETEELVTEELLPFQVATFLTHGREQCATTSSLGSARGAEARALDEGVCVTPETVEETKEDCSSKLVGELCTVSCVSGYSNSVDFRRSFCVSPMKVFCTSSGMRTSRALRMCALMHRTWTTPVSVIAATRRCGQATRAQPGARRTTYLVSEIPSKRSLASQMVLCQEHPCLRAFAMFSIKG